MMGIDKSGLEIVMSSCNFKKLELFWAIAISNVHKAAVVHFDLHSGFGQPIKQLKR